MSFPEYWLIFRRRWLSIVGCTVVCVALALGFTAASPRIYTATATDFVALTSANSGDSPLSGAQFAAQRVKSYIEIFGSPDVLVPVIDELSLDISPGALAGQVTVTNPPQTVLLQVSASDVQASRAAEIANAVAIQLGRVIEKLETPTGQEVAPVKVTLTEPATPPASPSSPRRTLNLVLGFVLGLAVGLSLAVVRSMFDRSIRGPSELDAIIAASGSGNVGVLGSVALDKEAKQNRLSALDPKAGRSEGFRTIRANLRFVNVDSPAHAIVITSPNPGDGKTSLACNLAITIAQSGKSVCLVDADLRKPTVASYLGIDAAVGLTDVLAGQCDLDQVLVSWNRGLLNVLLPGPIPPNPSELLESQQMEHLLAELKRKFDYVILDSSPLLAVADAAILTHQADGAILVVRHGTSTRDGVHQALAALRQSTGKLLGTVFNGVPKSAGYGDRYGYGYGYGYGNKTEAVPAATAKDSP